MAELGEGGGDGVADPCADVRVTGLVDGEVVGGGEEERLRWVEAPVAEERVQGDGEEGGEGGEEGRGLRRGERGWRWCGRSGSGVVVGGRRRGAGGSGGGGHAAMVTEWSALGRRWRCDVGGADLEGDR